MVGVTRRDRAVPSGRHVLIAGLSLAIVACACTSDEGSPGPGAVASPGTIPQPSADGLQVAPESERVDLAIPTFSHPTNVTNPLLPVSRQDSVLLAASTASRSGPR